MKCEINKKNFRSKLCWPLPFLEWQVLFEVVKNRSFRFAPLQMPKKKRKRESNLVRLALLHSQSVLKYLSLDFYFGQNRFASIIADDLFQPDISDSDVLDLLHQLVPIRTFGRTTFQSLYPTKFPGFGWKKTNRSKFKSIFDSAGRISVRVLLKRLYSLNFLSS